MPKDSKLSVSEAEIGLRAYHIWEAEGKPAGKDFDHWLRAEAELAGNAAQRQQPEDIRKAQADLPGNAAARQQPEGSRKGQARRTQPKKH